MASISINVAVFGSLIFPISPQLKNDTSKRKEDTLRNNSLAAIRSNSETETGHTVGDKYKEKLKNIYTSLGISFCRQKSFSLFCLAIFLSVKGILVPKVFLLDVTNDKGIESQQGSFLISIMGISDLIWQVLITFHLHSWYPLYGLYMLLLLVCGIYAWYDSIHMGHNSSKFMLRC